MTDLIANRPTDVPTRETLGFLISYLPLGAKVLEVGCGDGQVACELLQRGYRVTGLDFRFGGHRECSSARSSRRRSIMAEVRQHCFVRRDRLHAFPAPHQPPTPSDRSRPGITKTERISSD